MPRKPIYSTSPSFQEKLQATMVKKDQPRKTGTRTRIQPTQSNGSK